MRSTARARSTPTSRTPPSLSTSAPMPTADASATPRARRSDTSDRIDDRLRLVRSGRRGSRRWRGLGRGARRRRALADARPRPPVVFADHLLGEVLDLRRVDVLDRFLVDDDVDALLGADALEDLAHLRLDRREELVLSLRDVRVDAFDQVVVVLQIFLV